MYKGITFTMPKVLWSVFCDNPLLARALPALAAEVIQAQVGARYGLRVGVIAILHTFNGELEFNSHVHTMVTAGGYGSAGTWVPSVYYNDVMLMKAWRKAVIKLLRAAPASGAALYNDHRWRDGSAAHREGNVSVDNQDSIVQVQNAFPEICRPLCEAAAHRAASHHLHWRTNRQILVQRQETASQGRDGVLTGRVY
jgi:hypothetical protein